MIDQFIEGRQRIAGHGPHPVGDRARGEVGIAAARQAHRAVNHPRSVRSAVCQDAGVEGETRAEPRQRQGGGEELGVGGRHEEPIGVQFVERLAAGQIEDLDAPKSRSGRLGGSQQLGHAVGQAGGERRRGQGPRQHHRDHPPAGHRPVTLDSSQSSRSSTITMQVPSNGIPTTTPTPQAEAA